MAENKKDQVAKEVATDKKAAAETKAPVKAADAVKAQEPKKAAPAPKKDGKAEPEAPKKPKVADPNRYRVRKLYNDKVKAALTKKFNYANPNEVPKLEKVVINMGLGDCKDNSKSFQISVEEMKLISGQKPVITNAKKSIANFKIRKGMNVGAKVTLRGDRMYDFVDKLFNLVLPRVRDFRGVSAKSFDGRGNYALGLKEQLIFPEITYDQVEKVRGMDICFVTTAKTDEEAKELLKELGMPFTR